MATIKKIKITGYCDHSDMAVKDDGIFTVKKHRVSDIKGTWKAMNKIEKEINKRNNKE